MGSFEVVEHTADVGIRAQGSTLEDCFSEAARGMMHLVTDLGSIRESQSHRFGLEARDLESLLANFLSEILYLHHTELFLFSRFSLKISKKDDAGYSLSGEGYGEPIDSKRHRWDQEIKAVTYHNLRVDLSPVPTVEVLFDI